MKKSIHIPTKEYVAIKILEKSRIHDKEELERVEKEIKYLKMFNHPNIIQIYEVIENTENFYIVMEYVEGGELFNYIVEHEKLEEKEASFFFAQLIYGIKEIHKQKICHRDMKPENLLLANNNLIKIIDFGLSNEYTDYLTTQCGSPCYAAPEMIRGMKYDGLMIDLWACGIILYAMLCGYLPFDDKDNNILFRKIMQCKLEFPSENETHLSEEAKDLISRILVPNPMKRITIDEVLSHPFLINGIKQYETINKPNYFHKEKIIFDYMEKVLKISNENQNINKMIKENKHNNYTTTYKLLKKKIMEGRFDYTYYNKEKEKENEKLNNANITSNRNVKIRININNQEKRDNINLNRRIKNKMKGSLRRSINEKTNDNNNNELKKSCSLDSTKNTKNNDLNIVKNNKYVKENDMFQIKNNILLFKDLIKKKPLFHEIILKNKNMHNFKKKIDTSVSVEKRQNNKRKKIKIISKTPPKLAFKYMNNPFTYEYDTYINDFNRKKIMCFPNNLMNKRNGLSEDKIRENKMVKKKHNPLIIKYPGQMQMQMQTKIQNLNIKVEKPRNVYNLSPSSKIKDIIKKGLSADKANVKFNRLKKLHIKNNHLYLYTKTDNSININQKTPVVRHKIINTELNTKISSLTPNKTPNKNDKNNNIKKILNKRIIITSYNNYKNKEIVKTPINNRKKNIVYSTKDDERYKRNIYFKSINNNNYNNYNTIQTNKVRNYMIKDNNDHNSHMNNNNNTVNANIIYNNYIYNQNNINTIKTERNAKYMLNKDKAKLRNAINNNNAKYLPLNLREKKQINKIIDFSNYHERTKTFNITNDNIFYDKKILDKNIYNVRNTSKNNSKNKKIFFEKPEINAFLLTDTNLSVIQIKDALIAFCKKYNYKYNECKENKYIISINQNDSFVLEINNESKGRILKFFHYKGSDEITKKYINKLWFEMNSNVYS